MADQINLFDANADYFDEFNGEIDFNKLNFKVHASLIYKLGESLIADEITALSELLKNSYDADASFCNLIIEPDYIDENGKLGKIEISDNGTGMDLKTILNGWLTISNSPKKKMKKENRTTDKFGRIPLGEKGLGRLSVQKLGRQVTMITKTKESRIESSLIIPWGEFLKNTTLDKINLVCSQNDVDNDKTYTKIIITQLINPDFWKTDEIKKDLEKTINQIISPFRFENNNFVISAKVGDFKIDVNNALFNDILKTSRSNYTFSVNKSEIRLILSYKFDFFKKRNISRDYPEFDFSRDYFQEMLERVKVKFPCIEYLQTGNEVYSISVGIPIEDYPKLKRNNNTGEVFYPGDFDGSIYDFSYDTQYISEIINNNDFVYALKENEYKDYIKTNKGIKVIRDGFVVQGYGDGDVDWLNISSSATTSGRYSDLRNENLIGYVRITGKNNQALKETTSREGFISDEYYQNFFTIIRHLIIKTINKTNEDLTEVLKNYLKEISIREDKRLEFPVDNIRNISNKATNVSKEINSYKTQMQLKIDRMISSVKKDPLQIALPQSTNEDMYNEIISEQKKVIDDLSNRFEEYLKEVDGLRKSVVLIQDNLENYNKRIGDIFELAGLGISVELFTHELYTTINNVNEKIRNTSNVADEIRYVSNSMNSLRKQIAYFHPGLKYVRMKKESIIISELVNSHLEFYKQKADSKDIIFKVDDKSENISIMANVGLINQVFDNLFSNAYYWLQYSRDVLKSIHQCEYHILIQNDGTVDVWDNGIGISASVENDVFNPFVSCKENGRGLGLFICKNNLENNNSSIRLLRERNEHGNLYKFHIDLSSLAKKEVM